MEIKTNILQLALRQQTVLFWVISRSRYHLHPAQKASESLSVSVVNKIRPTTCR